MAAKTKTAYFFRPRIVEADESRTDPGLTFWADFHATVKTLAHDDRRLTLYGRKYWGAARTSVDPAQDYFYIARVRDGADFPDATDLPDSEKANVLTLPGDLIEPLYARVVSGLRNDIVTIRTSGGPTVSAFEAWVTAVLGLEATDRRFELEPILKDTAQQKLDDAVGASKFEIKVGIDQQLDTVQGETTTSKAVRELHKELGGASVEISVSVGVALPGESLGEKIKGELRSALRLGAKKAKATLLLPVKGGGVTRDHVDFIKDRLTEKVSLGESADERPTPTVVLQALGEAVRLSRGGKNE